jgi:hypothetical protein
MYEIRYWSNVFCGLKDDVYLRWLVRRFDEQDFQDLVCFAFSFLLLHESHFFSITIYLLPLHWLFRCSRCFIFLCFSDLYLLYLIDFIFALFLIVC